MNLSLYRETELESWIYSVYKQNDIKIPSDMLIRDIADAFNCEIVIWDKKSKAIWDDEFGTIFLNNKLKGDEKREVFFHELGHPFLHIGNQSKMPESFNDLQEEQVELFMLYAAMPMYMIKQLDLPRYENQFTSLLAWTFDVSTSLASKRIEQIKRRIFQEQSHQQFVSRIAEQRSTYDPLDPSRWSDETKRIMEKLSRQLATKGVKV